MSLWQFRAHLDGWNRSQGGKEALGDEEASQIAASLNAPPVWG